MRILIFHGYLLAGTGSNIYNARLARALVGLGHEVHLLCQDRHPDDQPWVDAAGDWDGGALQVRSLHRVRCTVYRPDIGGLLPVYVEDPYEGIEARAFARCSDAEIARYIDANVAAVREVLEHVRPDLALANHLVMGPAILARALAGSGVGYAVKVHGSALEYTVKPDPERFLPYAREGVRAAAGVLVGSGHTARSLWAALGDPAVEARTRLGPPGVDVELFKPLPARRRPAEPAVAFVGKLIVNKGVDLLIAAWPLVLERVPRARLEIVGFGGDREWLECLTNTLAAGRIEEAGGGARRHLLAFLDDLRGARRERYVAAARALPERVRFVGRYEHDRLAELLPRCEALVVPSTFPEAFGMVAVEGAACGALPVSAAHSGLAEVSAALARAVPAPAAGWLSFPVDDHAVPAIAERVVGWLESDPQLRERTRTALVGTVRERWSWEGVARGVIAAARGELEWLPAP
ncbi:MAG TPA: glycosyltransferase family 4 protein [Solirubrobacteraceae bacterium]|jgi:glycosyltransferase involved in cell wall biosynthesis|nr:glycosyltransferase family 4 protein [Solirubrobacteraceae bacterium]